ncbi:MAG: hypothetical protein V2B20_23310 [Pseudomonadota bacterium]
MNRYIKYPDTFGNLEKNMQRLFDALASRKLTPFAGNDSSVGMEYELQVAVEGDQKDVDLPTTISSSTYFKNVVKRSARGDLPPASLQSLKDFLTKNNTGVWENSWVRFPEGRLTAWSQKLLAADFQADKSNPASKPRTDIHRFRCIHRGQECLRMPISYLLKLSLANAISSDNLLTPALFETGTSLMHNLLSDNTSPEILSFTIPVAGQGRIGDLAAAESARTLLLCQILVQFANKTMGLEESGQKCLLYCAPHAPSRQKHLNTIVPDSYYRHLFISPCLSGWNRGEEKHRYMELCHKTLSRSQLNAIGKLKDAGIITRNLIVLPNTSNTCLANNGTHVSLGSRMLSEMAGDNASPFTPTVEKYFGDLVIKIVEHFLPLFVNTYSAAPYRLDFTDFHPEKVLGFLPHELDYTHLRMIWRRWQKKAKIGFLGKTITPFGPRWLDGTLAKILRLRGDLVPDFRLIDYLVTLLSTETSPGLNGMPGNHERLKEDLGEMGIFDPRMSIYLPYRQRIYATSGYAGFEGRSYSLFHSLREDMAEAVDMQNLVTALACRYILEGKVSHIDIPDKPSIESERRQIFFGKAIGIPTFYVRANTGNRFLRRILTDIPSKRCSRRYKGYIRIQHDEYNLALLRLLEADAADLIAAQNLGPRLDSLRGRLTDHTTSTFRKIITGVQGELPGKKNPFNFPAEVFNSAMERYYRTDLKSSYLDESLTVLVDDCRRLDKRGDPGLRQIMATIATDTSASEYILQNRQAILEESAKPRLLQEMLRIVLAIIHYERNNP